MTVQSAIQTNYRFLPHLNRPGAVWRRGPNDRFILNAVDATPNVQAVVEATAVNNAGDLSGLYIDGALYEITSTASTAGDVAAMKARLDAAVLSGSLPAGTTVVAADPTITITFGDFGPHTVTAFSPATADWTPIATTTEGSTANNSVPGMWKVYDSSGGDPSVTRVKDADASGLRLAGLVHEDDRFPRHTDPDASSGLTDPEAIPSKRMMKLWRCGIPLALLVTGAAPVVGEPVYRVFTGPDTGKTTTGTGAVNEQQELTFTNGGAGTVAGQFDALPVLTFADQGSDNANAAQFAIELQNSASYSEYTVVSVVANVVTVETPGGVSHTFTDSSSNPPNIAAVVTQQPTAATAELVPGASFASTANGEAGELTVAVDLNLP